MLTTQHHLTIAESDQIKKAVLDAVRAGAPDPECLAKGLIAAFKAVDLARPDHSIGATK